ncbi:breast carcinoma-amplified sequence 4 isoform X3 [Myotis myotis]|uniref:breast carcinoma-amplified sequence 4 isoform X3 n=1 Tax=Myotis myotis TaxID=51298 RepID=UPI00174C6EF5|nr:breast carcinoma-amplified sequence 4 isoform X3 [Myotis myotis]
MSPGDRNPPECENLLFTRRARPGAVATRATGWRCPLGPALRRRGPLRAPDLPPPGWPRGMQPAGGGAPRPGRGDGLPGCLRQRDPASPPMLLVDADRPEPMRSGARELALVLTPEPGAEAKEVEETIEGMLLRLEEFCSLANMAFVKMVGHHVSFLEDHVLRAERRHGAFSQALRRWGWPGSRGLPSFRNNLPRPASPPFELPALYRTEDYFPVDAGEAAPQAPRCRGRL